MTSPRFTSSYGILDIEKGRKALAKHLKANGGLPVLIHAVLTDPYGSDDGVSIEFNMEVLKVEVSPSPTATGIAGGVV